MGATQQSSRCAFWEGGQQSTINNQQSTILFDPMLVHGFWWMVIVTANDIFWLESCRTISLRPAALWLAFVPSALPLGSGYIPWQPATPVQVSEITPHEKTVKVIPHDVVRTTIIGRYRQALTFGRICKYMVILHPCFLKSPKIWLSLQNVETASIDHSCYAMVPFIGNHMIALFLLLL
jgi:hypothetical protein